MGIEDRDYYRSGGASGGYLTTCPRTIPRFPYPDALPCAATAAIASATAL